MGVIKVNNRVSMTHYAWLLVLLLALPMSGQQSAEPKNDPMVLATLDVHNDILAELARRVLELEKSCSPTISDVEHKHRWASVESKVPTEFCPQDTVCSVEAEGLPTIRFYSHSHGKKQVFVSYTFDWCLDCGQTRVIKK